MCRAPCLRFSSASAQILVQGLFGSVGECKVTDFVIVGTPKHTAEVWLCDRSRFYRLKGESVKGVTPFKCSHWFHLLLPGNMLSFNMKSDISSANEDWQQQRCLQQAEFGSLLYADLNASTKNNLCKSRITSIWLSPEYYSRKLLPSASKQRLECVFIQADNWMASCHSEEKKTIFDHV